MQSVIAIWRNLGSSVTPALLLPVATALVGRGRIGPRWTLAAMGIAFGVSLLWVLAGSFPLFGRPAAYPWSLEPIYAGLAATQALKILAALFDPIPGMAERSRKEASPRWNGTAIPVTDLLDISVMSTSWKVSTGTRCSMPVNIG